MMSKARRYWHATPNAHLGQFEFGKVVDACQVRDLRQRRLTGSSQLPEKRWDVERARQLLNTAVSAPQVAAAYSRVLLTGKIAVTCC